MKFYTVPQIGELLQLSRSKIYELIAGGEIVPHRIGGSIRISQENLESYVDSCRDRRAKGPRKAPRPRLRHLV